MPYALPRRHIGTGFPVYIATSCKERVCLNVYPHIIYVCGGGPIVNLHLHGQCNVLAAAAVNYRVREMYSGREGHLDNIIVVVVPTIIHLPRYFRSRRFITRTPKITVCFVFSAKFKYYIPIQRYHTGCHHCRRRLFVIFNINKRYGRT